jgi:methionyl-tRNA formyltransferase
VNIGFFGDREWARQFIVDTLDSCHIKIKFIVLRYGVENSEIQDLAIKNSIDLYVFENVNSNESIEVLSKYDVDLFVSISYDQIFKRSTLNLPKLMSINAHAGMLPFYRGRNPINWAIINNENFIGMTIHCIDEGIDTGDIILQEMIEVSESIYYDEILKVCIKRAAQLTLEALNKIYDGSYCLTKQDDIHPYGFYCIKRRSRDQIINWSDTSTNIFNHIRALHAPDLYAETFYKGNIIKIKTVKKIKEASSYIGVPGSIIHVLPDKSFFVKTGDSYIHVCTYQSLVEVNIRVGEVLE